ncbi:MAG: protein-L-isoaspartate O-methyltransferase family protein [Pseudomonadota bacterium]|uniref:protein-L-isoaspartate O-methyltransferase family protein n=1 Tax=Thermithiobacillus tepidarius TaxID=929 RepID=UPI0004244C70|nr:protein-L-isoaspartate O-methyltransferase [Thermithiobacillus tepidarius]
MDFELARRNMIESQIRTWEVLNNDVLETIARVKREEFVPAAYRKMAFADFQIPLGNGEVMWTPKLEARILQELDLRPADKVLEVGTGSGYFTALLASLAGHVFSVDDVAEFSQSAKAKLAAHGIDNVTLETGDAARGWDFHAAYDAIVITGSMPRLPAAFREALAINGRLIAIIGESPVMNAKRVTRVAEHAFEEEDLFETDVPALRNVEEERAFVF